ncbi:BppU family phage baseplate upper protein [Clostridium perfringens]|uniref:BppU family phage baseplate upper protein n=1 Tax=Clostridium perfringens TaxID=1502 RepID=UPI0039EC2178|nr:BppU family phage baseplate upper protein [Clostridium perfringens]EHR1332509.1 BppU family phage baseplate upper protein [Clostridium perfringens]EHR1426089.1 BppU family phage baseplate upper protein [Clostridium perfringens]
MQYIQTKTVYIDRDELTEIKAIEHDIKTRFINFKFIGANKDLDISHCIVRVYALNSKGNEIFNNLTIIDGAKGIAQLELTDSLLVPGTTEYKLKIYTDNGGILSSNRFNLIVSPDLMTGNAIEGTNEYKALDEALKTVGELNSMKVSIGENATAINKNKNLIDINTNNINQNLEAFNEFKDIVEKTSYFNMISNPIFDTGDYKNWELWDSTTSYSVQPDTSLSHNYSLKLQCSKRSQGITQTVKGLQYGKTYTFKAKLKVEEGTPGLMVRNDNQWNGSLFKVEQGYNQWVEVSLTFMAREGTMPVYIGNVSTSTVSTFWVSEVMLYEGSLDIPFIDNLKELYTRNFQVDKTGMVFGDGNGTYSNTNNKGELEYVTEGIYNKYVALKYIASFSIPPGNPGTVNVKLPKEFTKRKNSLVWGVVPKGYYYNTSGNFFPFHVAVNVAGSAYEQDGYMYCPVEGYCRIQNAENAGDVQPQSINGVLIALA